jgi:hypothetical protein
VTDEEKARKAADGLTRRVYEHGGDDAVRKSAAIREQAIRDLQRQQKK